MNRNFKDITGEKFGRLTVISLHGRRSKTGRAIWNCRCECGQSHLVMGVLLRNGGVQSCGCLRREQQTIGSITHGQTKTPEYRIWGLMLNRCSNPKTPDYPRYGGRGITVCERWRRFENFFADMGPRPSAQHSIERINNEGDYEPINVRWATWFEQCRNRRNNRILTLNGTTKTVSQWAEATGIHSRTIRQRIDYCGWTVERALTTPLLRQ